jgi:ribosomal protein S18 acetylase RimI-like enzyme
MTSHATESIELHPLRTFDAAIIQPLIIGYESAAEYVLTHIDTPEVMRIELRLAPLAKAFVKRWEPIDAETLKDLARAVESGYSWGAFAGEELVGVALASPQEWNQTLWVWEFHVGAAWQRRGIGERLMAAVVEQATQARFRAVVCETQNTNMPAITFYRSQGFVFDGARLTLYAGSESEGEVAIFMKRHLLKME